MKFVDSHPPHSLRRLEGSHIVWKDVAPGPARTWSAKIGTLEEGELVIVLEQPRVTPIGMVFVLTRFGAGFINKHNFRVP
jgi:hypothetical protein